MLADYCYVSACPAVTGPVCLSQRAFYSTYDVTDFLDPPSVGHVLSVELGNGYLHGVGGEPTGEKTVMIQDVVPWKRASGWWWTHVRTH